MIFGRNLQHDLQRGEADRECGKRDRIYGAPRRAIGPVDVDHGGDDDRDRQADRDVDEKEPIPRELFRHEPAEERTHRRGQHGDAAGDEDRARVQRARKHFVPGSENRRDHRARAEAL